MISVFAEKDRHTDTQTDVIKTNTCLAQYSQHIGNRQTQHISDTIQAHGMEMIPTVMRLA